MNIIERISNYKKSDPDYARDLMTALYIIGGVELEEQLNKAEE
jgi:hypothetical protein